MASTAIKTEEEKVQDTMKNFGKMLKKKQEVF